MVSDPESEQELAESHLMLKNDCLCFRMSSSFVGNNPSLQFHTFRGDRGKCHKTGNPSISTPDLPFAPIDLQQASLPALIADCRIDHSVGPVVDTVGGTTAGMERWQTFRQQGLKRYADRRNDPLLDGSSRMSAYLHYGMVSPLRIAREAAAAGGAGAEKYVEELLICQVLK